MDVRLINPFIAATEHVFSMMAGCDVTSQPPRVLETLEYDTSMVYAVILMEGGAEGAAVLRIPTSMALKVATAMAGQSIKVADAYDALGELVNMVTGNAKRDLSSRMVHISIPQIITGTDDLEPLKRLKPWLSVPFVAALGTFDLAISVTCN